MVIGEWVGGGWVGRRVDGWVGGRARVCVYMSVSHRPHEGHAERAHRRHETNRHTAAAAHCAAPQSWSDGGRTSSQPSGDWSQQHALPQPERAAGADIGRSGRKCPSGPLSAPWQRLASVSNRWQPDWPQHKRDSIQRSQKPQQDPRGSPRRRHWSWEGRVLLCARTQPVPPPSSRSARWQCVVQESYVLLAPTGCVARTARICHTDQQHGTPPASSPPPGLGWCCFTQTKPYLEHEQPADDLARKPAPVVAEEGHAGGRMRREEQRAGVHHGWPEGLAAEGHESLARAAEPRSPPRARRGKTTRRSGGGGGCTERGWGTRAGRGRRARVCVWRVLSVTFISDLFVCLFVFRGDLRRHTAPRHACASSQHIVATSDREELNYNCAVSSRYRPYAKDAREDSPLFRPPKTSATPPLYMACGTLPGRTLPPPPPP